MDISYVSGSDKFNYRVCAIIISDELSPDTCRMWDMETGERLDKARFRLDLGDMVASYGIVLEKLKNVMETEE